MVQVAEEVGFENVGAFGVDFQLIGYRARDIDIVLRRGDVIEVGGPGKILDLGKFGQQLQALTEYAKAQPTPTQAYFYYAAGTPQAVLDLAVRRLGADNVRAIP